MNRSLRKTAAAALALSLAVSGGAAAADHLVMA